MACLGFSALVAAQSAIVPVVAVQMCEVRTEGKFGFVAGGETQHRAQDGTSSSQE